MEKVNLACCESGIQEVTGRTVIIVPSSFFSMKKVYEKNDSQKGKKENYIAIFFLNLTHITL